MDRSQHEERLDHRLLKRGEPAELYIDGGGGFIPLSQIKFGAGTGQTIAWLGYGTLHGYQINFPPSVSLCCTGSASERSRADAAAQRCSPQGQNLKQARSARCARRRHLRYR